MQQLAHACTVPLTKRPPDLACSTTTAVSMWAASALLLCNSPSSSWLPSCMQWRGTRKPLAAVLLPLALSAHRSWEKRLMVS